MNVRAEPWPAPRAEDCVLLMVEVSALTATPYWLTESWLSESRDAIAEQEETS